MEIILVSATPKTEEEFKGMPLASNINITSELCQVAYKNKCGLPAIYNKAITANANRDAIVVFAHHDIAIQDAFIPEKLAEPTSPPVLNFLTNP